MDANALGPLEANASVNADGEITVTFAKSPDARVRFSASIIIQEDGSVRTTSFSLNLPAAAAQAAAPARLGPRGPIPTVTLADGTILPLAKLAGTNAVKASSVDAEGARRGLAKSAKELLSALSGTEGVPYAIPLTKSLGMMKAYTDRLISMGTLRPEDADSATEGFLAAAVEALSASSPAKAFPVFAAPSISPPSAIRITRMP